MTLRLGVNVDHVATLRNARGGVHPDPVRAAQTAMEAGADGITAHLREDRRHIRDDDIARLKAEVALPLNFEMAVTDEMIRIAVATKPHACCLVPEKRTEVTTEGGLDVAGRKRVTDAVKALADAGIRVSLFIDPEETQVRAAAEAGAPVIELHTGRYCEADNTARDGELTRIENAARVAEACGLECHAGHGLTFDTVGPIAAIATVRELNIGHFLVGEAVFMGFSGAIREMRRLMDEARATA